MAMQCLLIQFGLCEGQSQFPVHSKKKIQKNTKSDIKIHNICYNGSICSIESIESDETIETIESIECNESNESITILQV